MTDAQKASIIQKNPKYRSVWPDIAETVPLPEPGATPPIPLPTFPGQDRVACIHFGVETGETVRCNTCMGALAIKLFQCEVYKTCTIAKPADGHGCCKGCASYEPVTETPVQKPIPIAKPPLEPREQKPVKRTLPRSAQPVLHAPRKTQAPTRVHTPKSLKWVYGITTVPERFNTTLPKTLASLKAGGFDSPRLFMDGVDYAILNSPEFRRLYGVYQVTPRDSRIGCHGNWYLALQELYIRNPSADRYAIFQDDMLCVRNLRRYLETIPYPQGPKTDTPGAGAYLNLFSFRENHHISISGGKSSIGFHLGAELNTSANGGKYHGRQQQAGRGAVALVFDHRAVQELLSSKQMVKRVQDPIRGGAGLLVDGGIVEAMNQVNIWEYVHNPSLVQHIGELSTIGHSGTGKAKTFPGENVDALSFLPVAHFNQTFGEP